MNLQTFEKLTILKNSRYLRLQTACRELLINHSLAVHAREYLDQRASSPNQSLFNFGWFPPDEHLDLLYNKISLEDLLKLNIVYQTFIQDQDCQVPIYKSILSNHNLIIPYQDIYGNTISLIGRTILSEPDRKLSKLQKYKFTKFSKSMHLFGLYQAKREILAKNFVVVVEGQIDCITCHQFGLKNVVALGGSSLTKYQFNLIKRLTNNIWLLLDNDEEGKKASERIIKKYENQANIKTGYVLDGYKDIDEYLRKSGNNLFTLEF